MKGDARPSPDDQVGRAIRRWAEHAERMRFIGCERHSFYNISAAQIQQILKRIAVEAHRASLIRLAAEREEMKLRTRRKRLSNLCCVVT